MEKESFIFKKEWRDAICELPAKVRAEVYAAIIEYGITGEAPQLKSMARMAFAFVRADIDRANAKEEREAAVSKEMRRRVMARWGRNDVNTQVNTQVNTDVYTQAIHKHEDVYTQVNTSKTPVSPRARVVGNQDNIEDSDIRDNNIQEEKESVGKKKTKAAPPSRDGTPPPAVEARRQAFYDSLVPYVGKYGKATIRAFFDYWSECNKPRTKMRFELEKTWETPRRLATWASRDDKFKTQANGNNSTDNQRQALQRAGDALDIMRQLRSEGEAAGQMDDHRGLRGGA